MNLSSPANEKKYNQILEKALINVPDIQEWHSKNIQKIFNNISWKQAILKLHSPKYINIKGNFLNRLIFDEIFSTLLINSKIRAKIKKNKKKGKVFNNNNLTKIMNKIKFKLTKDQIKTLYTFNLLAILCLINKFFHHKITTIVLPLI